MNQGGQRPRAPTSHIYYSLLQQVLTLCCCAFYLRQSYHIYYTLLQQVLSFALLFLPASANYVVMGFQRTMQCISRCWVTLILTKQELKLSILFFSKVKFSHQNQGFFFFFNFYKKIYDLGLLQMRVQGPMNQSNSIG